MRYNSKMQCAKYLNSKYGANTFTNILKQKKKESYDESVLKIIRDEYDLFFENIYKNMSLSNEDKKIQNYIKEFDIFIDLVYSNSREVLKMYTNIFKTEKAYITKLGNYDKNLADYIVKSINIYLK